MWQQFVQRADEWIGGTLEDFGDSMDRALSGGSSHVTKITDIKLTPNGKESACFTVEGAVFTCSGDVRYLGVTGGDEGWITLSGYGGHTWRFKPAAQSFTPGVPASTATETKAPN